MKGREHKRLLFYIVEWCQLMVTAVAAGAGDGGTRTVTAVGGRYP